MNKKKNSVGTIGIRQIEKSTDLTLGVAKKDIDKYEKIVSAFGNVAPAIVATNGSMYSLIDGQARLEACMRAGIREIPAVVAQPEGEAEQLKLSLLLSSSREQGSALSEGAIIGRLVKEHRQSLRDISLLTGRSKAWLSKRHCMAQNLSPQLKDMVLNGTVCTRTAEEISKLPQEEQVVFATNVTRESLCKDDVHQLVKLYRSPDASLPLCRLIIESPAEALLSCQGAENGKTRAKKYGSAGRLHRTAYLAINILEVLGKMIYESDSNEIAAAMEHLLKLRGKMQVTMHLIMSKLDTDVSLGKRGGEEND